jgi:EAL domain-containing protein (putative c-di-GMP-specific phosphodiesterase class I)
LRVEVSETYLMDHPEHAVHVLNGLADIGTGIAIGDFGHGYSSLGYLERFPFGAIRLSRVVTRPDPSGVRPAILRSVVTLAHDLDVDLMADGLETESDAIQFVQLGFGLGQGATFGPAMTAQETRKLIKG